MYEKISSILDKVADSLESISSTQGPPERGFRCS